MGARAGNRKSDRIDVRVDRKAKATIARAAALRHQSLSDFVLSAAIERSREVIERSAVLELDEREAERFLAALASPPAPNEKLREAAAQFRKAVGEGRLRSA